MRKHLLAAAVAVSAAVVASAPAQAAKSFNFDNVTNTGAFYVDGLTGPFNESFQFNFLNAGSGTFTVTTASSTTSFSSGSIGGTPFTFGTCLGGLACGIAQNAAITPGLKTLTIVGNAGASGSFGGSIVFTPAAVPEPASWALMIGGFGLAGGALRRRATKVSYRLA